MVARQTLDHVYYNLFALVVYIKHGSVSLQGGREGGREATELAVVDSATWARHCSISLDLVHVLSLITCYIAASQH